ncbi:MAG: NAD(P)(+) transhydrogenase (Re/Si-specific) subunit beta [Candidatus Bipolaricaulia bacterium]
MPDAVETYLTPLAYLVASALFIFGLKRLGSPATARSGNQLAAVGMLIAVVVTLLDREILNYGLIVAGIVVGSAIGAASARLIKMTAMPQMVGVFNGLGGGASALVASAEFARLTSGEIVASIPTDTMITISLGTLIGAVTFSGSMIAFGKLQGILTGRPVTYPLQKIVNLILFLGILGMGGFLVGSSPDSTIFIVLLGVSLVLGVLLVIPIGGADMPVIISLLNSFSGLAASAAGFVVANTVLIISGALVGASGLILTAIMSRAMNRSVANVLFGAVGTADMKSPVVGAGASTDGKSVRSVTAEDAAIVMAYADSVIIVPGYGMAVAQAQHDVRELADLLEARGVQVKYAIHPVAGRMPGHMNVLLAEANVPYPQLYDMDAINPEFNRTDVALVVGANDVVNPAARTEPDSPIYGMPILNVDKARHIIFLKRSLNPGFAGVDNELFFNPKTMMLFGDAKDSLDEVVSEIKSL